MKRYIFSNGIVSVDERVNLRPEKRHHPLRSSPVWIKLPIGIPVPLVPEVEHRKYDWSESDE